MTANAFKLGTVLTRGWFWVRPDGCSVLYRGGSMGSIDFENVLVVAPFLGTQISPPTYIEHKSSTTYYYLVRRVNTCGDEERTLHCAARVVIDGEGELVSPEPDDVLQIRVEQVANGKVRLVWFYCPVAQQSEPAYFRIYTDGGTGQINYENPADFVSYHGQGFYRYESESLNPGRHVFAVRAEDTAGADDGSYAQRQVHVDTTSPTVVEILSIEAI